MNDKTLNDKTLKELFETAELVYAGIVEDERRRVEAEALAKSEALAKEMKEFKGALLQLFPQTLIEFIALPTNEIYSDRFLTFPKGSKGQAYVMNIPGATQIKFILTNYEGKLEFVKYTPIQFGNVFMVANRHDLLDCEGGGIDDIDESYFHALDADDFEFYPVYSDDMGDGNGGKFSSLLAAIGAARAAWRNGSFRRGLQLEMKNMIAAAEASSESAYQEIETILVEKMSESNSESFTLEQLAEMLESHDVDTNSVIAVLFSSPTFKAIGKEYMIR